jgi:hypothetical protein
MGKIIEFNFGGGNQEKPKDETPEVTPDSATEQESVIELPNIEVEGVIRDGFIGPAYARHTELINFFKSTLQEKQDVYETNRALIATYTMQQVCELIAHVNENELKQKPTFYKALYDRFITILDLARKTNRKKIRDAGTQHMSEDWEIISNPDGLSLEQFKILSGKAVMIFKNGDARDPDMRDRPIVAKIYVSDGIKNGVMVPSLEIRTRKSPTTGQGGIRFQLMGDDLTNFMKGAYRIIEIDGKEMTFADEQNPLES